MMQRQNNNERGTRNKQTARVTLHGASACVLSARVKQMETAKKATITLARLVHKWCRLCKGEQIQHGRTQQHGRTDST